MQTELSPSKIDLKKFCVPASDARFWLRTPFPHERNWYASNGAIAIRMGIDPFDEVEAASDVELEPGPKRLTEIFANQKDEDFVDLGVLSDLEIVVIQMCRDCRECQGEGKTSSRKCKTCDGEGEFSHEGYDYHCRSCDGQGRVTKANSYGECCSVCQGRGEVDGRSTIGEYKFNSRLLQLAIEACPDGVMQYSVRKTMARVKSASLSVDILLRGML